MEKHLMVALMILSLHRSWVNSEDSVEQSPRTLTIQEGMNATFYCNYSSRGSDYLHWYRQDLRKSLVNLFVLITSGEVKHNGRLTVTLNTKDQQSSLHITASQPEDSATYLCAKAQCSPGI
uniref:Ig-like domain-containing protein n=1 Tax=Vombatus ursinus TaxID=29139 RepID=A0A4X2LN32_VOMUR